MAFERGGSGMSVLRGSAIELRMAQESTVSVTHYIQLAKPRVLSMVLISMAVGFYLAGAQAMNWMQFGLAIAGTALVGAGAMCLNEYLEWKSDAKMNRTKNRPIPAGKVTPAHALQIGLALTATGSLWLLFLVNPASFGLALATSVSYLAAYTPLKKVTSLATFAGAISGALPPLIGWTAAGGTLGIQAFSLFLIIFFWQMPHFLAIDWMYRGDYARAGFKTLAVIDATGKMVARQMAVNMSALLCVSLLPAVFQIAGPVYFFGAFALGICFAVVVVSALSNLDERARYVLRASVIYLPLVLMLMAIDRI